MSNGAYPPKWTPLPVPSHNSSPMDPQLMMQQNMFKNNKDMSYLKPNPPDYYQYPHPRPAYPGYMSHPQTPYEMSSYNMAPQLMHRRPNPEWNHWATDMGNVIEHIPQQEQNWSHEWGHHSLYPQMYNPMYRGAYPGMQRDHKQVPSPIQQNMSHHPLPNNTMSGIRTIQAPRSNLSQANSDFPPFSPNPPHLSPPPVPFGIVRTPTPSLPDLHREVSKESCLSTPLTPFRQPGMELGSFPREEITPLPRQPSNSSNLALGTPPSAISATKKTTGRKRAEPSLPFEQWINDHGLYPEFRRETGREGKEFYYQLLQYLYEAQGGPYATPTRVPSVGGDEVNLFRLHKVVESHGGVKFVCEKKEWKKIFQLFPYPSKGTAGIKSLKQIYLKWLLPFICHRRGEPIEATMELCRSATRPRKLNCHSDTLSVTSPTAPSEESQEIPESPLSLISCMSANGSPKKIPRDRMTPSATLDDRPTSSDTKPPFELDGHEDTSHHSKTDPLSFLEQISPPFAPNKTNTPLGMDPSKVPRIKQEHQPPDGSDTHATHYPYYPPMYPHMTHDPYHVMGPRHPYQPRLMHPLLPHHRWPSHKQEEWQYGPPRLPQVSDTSRTQSTPPAHDIKPRVQREKPAAPSREVSDKPLVPLKRPQEMGRVGMVEFSTPILRKRKKQLPNMNMTEPFRLTMALRSGVLTDTVWALDYLTILLNHNGTRDLYGLHNAQGLLDALVACWRSCLAEIFPGEVETEHTEETKPDVTPLYTDEELPPHLRNVPEDTPRHIDTSSPPQGFEVTITGTDSTHDPATEDEVVRPPDNVVFLHSIHETQIGSMAITISNLVRCLSCIPGNELHLAKHDSLLSLIGQLLLLKHLHPPAICLPDRTHDTSDTSDSLDDTCDTTEYVLEAHKSEWWWSYLEYVREDVFVVLCNVAGALDFSLYPSRIGQTLLFALIHWLTCPSAICHDPLPRLSNTNMLSPKRLVLECLSKLSVLPSNVDYMLATPPCQLRALIKELSKWSVNKKDTIARQFVFMLLHNLCGTSDLCPHYLIARQTPILQVLMDCVGQPPPPFQQLHMQRGNKIANLQEEFTFSCTLRRRAAWTLLRLSTHPENRALFLGLQPRLLALACPTPDTFETFKSDPHLRQLILEIISHLTKE